MKSFSSSRCELQKAWLRPGLLFLATVVLCKENGLGVMPSSVEIVGEDLAVSAAMKATAAAAPTRAAST